MNAVVEGFVSSRSLQAGPLERTRGFLFELRTSVCLSPCPGVVRHHLQLPSPSCQLIDLLALADISARADGRL